MSSENQQSHISDTSKPNAGRVYDYFLGGSLNFEVDRKAAEEIKKVAPFVEHLAQLIRWFLGKGVKKALELGLTDFIDFASGLPTVDHIHFNTPPGVKIIYSDIDPVTVEIGLGEISNNPFVKYLFCDIRIPEILLNSKEVKSLLGENRKVCVGYNGICYFLTDEEIQYSMKVIYDWVEKGSILFFCDNDVEDASQTVENDENVQSIHESYKKMNQPVYFRSRKKMLELIKPWKVLEPGFLDLERWHNLPSDVNIDVVKFDKGGGFYGGILIK